MKLVTGRAAICGASLLTATAAVIWPASANSADSATPAWRVFKTHHYRDFSSYQAVTATGKNNAWVFGEAGTTTGPQRPVARHWTGRAWREVALPAGINLQAYDASASSASNVWALAGVRDSGPSYALRWNGRKWSIAKKWTDDLASDVITHGPRDVWVFGYSRAGAGIGTWHFNGKRWSHVKPGKLLLGKGSAVSARDIWAVGARQNTGCGDRTVAHYNGKGWKAVPLGGALPPDIPQSSEGGPYQCVHLHDVTAPSSKNVWVTGYVSRSDGQGSDQTQPVLAHWNGKKWQRKSIPGGWTPHRLEPDGRGGLWITGSKSAGDPPVDSTPLMHRAANGRWTTAKINAGGGHAKVYDLTLIPGTRSLWGVGRVETANGYDATIYRRG